MTLTTTIAGLLQQAQAMPDTIIEIRLKRGLLLGVKWNRTFTTLRLKRDAGSPPNAIEWKTVIDCWPCSVTNVQGPSLQDNGHALVGRWPSPERVEQITLMENIDETNPTAPHE